MLYIKLFIEREKNTGQSAPECPFKCNCCIQYWWYPLLTCSLAQEHTVCGSTVWTSRCCLTVKVRRHWSHSQTSRWHFSHLLSSAALSVTKGPPSWWAQWLSRRLSVFYCAMHIHSAYYAVARCLSIRLSVCHILSHIESKQLYISISSEFFHSRVAPPF